MILDDHTPYPATPMLGWNLLKAGLDSCVVPSYHESHHVINC